MRDVSPFNQLRQVRLLDHVGELLAEISGHDASFFLQYGAATLLDRDEPTLRLKFAVADLRAIYLRALVSPNHYRQAKKVVRREARARLPQLSTHASRTEIYGNYVFQRPDGTPIFHGNALKALWYLNRKLVACVPGEGKTLRFFCETNGPGHAGDAYYLIKKESKCVVCGSAEGLNRHHVLPVVYRRHLPTDRREHSYHDILPTCLDCHHRYEAAADELKAEIAREFRFPVDEVRHRATGERVVTSESLTRAVKAAVALVRWAAQIPPDRQDVLWRHIHEHLGYPARLVDVQHLADFARLRHDELAPDRIGHGEYVVAKIMAEGRLQAFVERWRAHFLAHANPQHMPAAWSLTRPVDRRTYGRKPDSVPG